MNKIVCAACKISICNSNGTYKILICSARHYDENMRIQILALQNLLGYDSTIKAASGDNQGFIDINGMYLTRKEALKVARENNQILDENEVRGDKLFSEDLY